MNQAPGPVSLVERLTCRVAFWPWVSSGRLSVRLDYVVGSVDHVVYSLTMWSVQLTMWSIL
jgi:hypothetical protein